MKPKPIKHKPETTYDFNKPYRNVRLNLPKELNEKSTKILIDGMYEHHGYHEGEFNHAEYNIVYQLVSNKVSSERIVEIFESFAHPDSYFRFCGDNRISYLTKTIQKIEKNISENESSFLKTIKNLELNFPNFTGRSAQNQMAVYSYILEIARKTGKLNGLAIACRAIEINRNIGRTTANKILNYLIEMGFIEKESASGGMLAAIYRIKTNNSEQTNNGISIEYDDIGLYNEWVDNDVFCHRGLGKIGLMIWIYLRKLNDSVTVKKISADTNLKIQSVRSKLKRMVKLNMVVQDNRHYSIADNNLKLNDIAVALKTFGKKKKRIRNVELERKRFYNRVHTIAKYRKKIVYVPELNAFLYKKNNDGDIVSFKELLKIYKKIIKYQKLISECLNFKFPISIDKSKKINFKEMYSVLRQLFSEK